MPIKDIRGLPNELQQFFAAAGKVFIKPFSILGVAESLTDEVATELIMLTGLSEKKAIQFVKALHFCDFVVERNSEWHFSPNILEFLNKRIDVHSEIVQKAHKTLFEIAIKGDIKSAGKTIPRYLVSGVGRAYHKSPSSPEEGLEYYSQVASELADGSQWLLGKLAIEQQARGILPASAIEPSFIRGMTFYKEQRYEDADKLFRRVILSKEIRIEVAIACHIVGRQTGRKAGGFTEAEELLRRSIEIGEEIKHYHHQAQALHTLGKLLGQDRSRAKEAEELLRRSIELLVQVNDKHGQAQALHTLGQLLGKDRSRAKEAEELLRRSIEIGEEIKHYHHQAQALHTLGQLLGKDRSRAKEAEELLRRSIELLVQVNDKHGQAQALHTLGQLLGKDRSRAKEAEELLRRSIELLVQVNDKHGQAQALHTLGQLLGKDRSRAKEAEELLRRSIEIGEENNHQHDVAQRLHTLGQLLGKDRSRAKEAEELLRRSIEIGEEIKHYHHQAQALHTLGQLLGKDRSRAKEAEELLRESYSLDKTKNGQAMILFTLGKLIWDKDPVEGRRLMLESVKINKTINNQWAVNMIEKELISKDRKR